MHCRLPEAFSCWHRHEQHNRSEREGVSSGTQRDRRIGQLSNSNSAAAAWWCARARSNAARSKAEGGERPPARPAEDGTRARAPSPTTQTCFGGLGFTVRRGCSRVQGAAGAGGAGAGAARGRARAQAAAGCATARATAEEEEGKEEEEEEDEAPAAGQRRRRRRVARACGRASERAGSSERGSFRVRVRRRAAHRGRARWHRCARSPAPCAPRLAPTLRP